MAVQFGFICTLITYENISSVIKVIAIASCWVLMEWIRLFLLSGFSFNPIGLALTGSVYTMQSAGLFGIYGLSFWIMVVNLFALRAYVYQSGMPFCIWGILALAPYIFGIAHYQIRAKELLSNPGTIEAILVQTAFPIEETLHFRNRDEFVLYVTDEWKKILGLIKKQKGKKTDLIVLPEFVVPFGTYTFMYPLDVAKEAFEKNFGPESLQFLPPEIFPMVKKNPDSSSSWVSNAYWAQGIANIFDAPILLGLEDVDEDESGERKYYSSAIFLKPQKKECRR